MVSAKKTFYGILKLRNMIFSFQVEFARFSIILAELGEVVCHPLTIMSFKDNHSN